MYKIQAIVLELKPIPEYIGWNSIRAKKRTERAVVSSCNESGIETEAHKEQIKMTS